jgi:hypothetical protein
MNTEDLHSITTNWQINDDTVTADDLKSMFDDDPQGSAELIRQRGRVLYSDRQKAGDIKIR